MYIRPSNAVLAGPMIVPFQSDSNLSSSRCKPGARRGPESSGWGAERVRRGDGVRGELSSLQLIERGKTLKRSETAAAAPKASEERSPMETVPSPTPLIAFSYSSSSRKFRGTTTCAIFGNAHRARCRRLLQALDRYRRE